MTTTLSQKKSVCACAKNVHEKITPNQIKADVTFSNVLNVTKRK